MKIRIAFLTVLAAASVLAAEDGSSMTGKWNLHSSIMSNDSDMVCTLAQTDDALTGKCATDMATFDVAGKVSGSKVTFSYKTEHEGQALTVIYDGAVDATKGMKGSVTVPEFSVGGEFTAVRSK